MISTFGLAEAHNVEALLNHAADFISTNMEDLLNSIHFLEADALDVAAFFRSEGVEQWTSRWRHWACHKNSVFGCYFVHAVKPRYTGPKSNGNPPITNSKPRSLQAISF